MKAFKLSSNDACGTSLRGYLEGISYADIVAKLGRPNCEGDQYKVAFEWIVENEAGETFTIYPWKNTNLYDDHSDSVATMKKTNRHWNIGGRTSDIDALKKFLGAL